MTGYYGGLDAGAGWDNNRSLSSAGFVAPDPVIFGNGGSDDVAFTGGAQIGCNMQFGSFVAGVEADFNYLDRNGGGNSAFPAIVPGALPFTNFGGGNRGNWFGTVRGRLGTRSTALSSTPPAVSPMAPAAAAARSRSATMMAALSFRSPR